MFGVMSRFVGMAAKSAFFSGSARDDASVCTYGVSAGSEVRVLYGRKSLYLYFHRTLADHLSQGLKTCLIFGFRVVYGCFHRYFCRALGADGDCLEVIGELEVSRGNKIGILNGGRVVACA